MRKLFSLALIALSSMSLLVGCSTSNQQNTTPANSSSGSVDNAQTLMKPTTKKNKLKIAYVAVVMNTSYEMVLAGIKEQIDSYGGGEWADLTIQAPSSNTSTLQEQPNIIEGLIQQDIDAIILATEDQEAMLPHIKAASEKGIPVFLFNMATLSENDPYYVTCVTFDQYKASYKIGEWANKHFTEPTEVAVLEGFPGIVNTQRLDGFKDAIKDNPNLTIVASQQADWTRAKGQSVTENILQANPNIKFIYGLYDEMALGAVAAVKASGHLDSIAIAGYDNTKDGRESIMAKELTVTVDTGSKEMGKQVLQAVKTFVQDGQPLDRLIDVESTVYDQSNISSFDVTNYEYVPKK